MTHLGKQTKHRNKFYKSHARNDIRLGINKCACQGRQDMADEEILNLILNREEKGLSFLAEKYEKLLIYIAAGILGSRIRDVEECVNDTYLKFWNNAKTYDMAKASMATYLKVIIRNTAINRLRDLKRHEDKAHNEDFLDIAATYADSKQNIENKIENKEKAQHLSRIIASLKEKDKELILRKYFYVQSSKVIAEAMNMTVTAVDSRLSRLRVKMKNQFDALYSQD